MNGHVTYLMIPIALGLVASTTASAKHGVVSTVIDIRSTAQAAASSSARTVAISQGQPGPVPR